MKQVDQARGIVARIAMREKELAELHGQLREVLDEAQNGPPAGPGDGSFDPDGYASHRSLERQMAYFFNALTGAKLV